MVEQLSESKREKYILLGIVGILLILVGVTFYPAVKTFISDGKMENQITGKAVSVNTKSSKNVNLDTRSSEITDVDTLSPNNAKDYYQMFKCSCCGKSIDVGCCGMAKERMAYVDELLLDGIGGEELVYGMVKKYGFDILMDQSKEQDVRDYIKSKASDNPPVIEIKDPKYDFGTISQADGVVSTVFNIKNTGESDLIIDNMDSSCMCTTARLIYKGEEGPKFGMSMHGDNPKDYSLTIPPGDSAQLRVYYDPMAHGVQKKEELKITREITIVSNDPVDFQKKVKIEVTQVR